MRFVFSSGKKQRDKIPECEKLSGVLWNKTTASPLRHKFLTSMLLKLIDNKELFVGWVRLLSDSEIIVTQHQRFKTLSAGLRSFFYRKKQLTQPTYQ